MAGWSGDNEKSFEERARVFISGTLRILTVLKLDSSHVVQSIRDGIQEMEHRKMRNKTAEYNRQGKPEDVIPWGR